jgi:BirA family biotin operon repressor/biotin-[acetyl-CoA-carboxylase] ligase
MSARAEGGGRNDAARIERELRDRGLGHVAVRTPVETESTNDDARRWLETVSDGPPPVSVLVATGRQRKGRGRAGRTWFQSDGAIAMSLGISRLNLSVLPTAPLAAGVAVAEAACEMGLRPRSEIVLKWPNDVLVRSVGDAEVKAGGILCESQILGTVARLVVGIGLNVDRPPVEVARERAGVLAATGLDVDHARLIARIVSRLLELVELPGPKVVAAWREWAIPWWGREVVVQEAGAAPPTRGTLESVDESGRLVLRIAGVTRAMCSGEMHGLRPVDSGTGP